MELWKNPVPLENRVSKSAPCSPMKPILQRTHTYPDAAHVLHKVPIGDGPYVRAKRVQLIEKDPARAIVMFWVAINAGDRVDSALKDMAIVMKQQNRPEEAIEAIKSLRSKCSDQAQESLDNILLDLYKRCGRLDDQVALLKHKLLLINQGMAFNGKRTKTARSHGKKFQVSLEQEATRLLGNLGWALMQQNNHVEAEAAYRKALSMELDNNKMCNLGICLMKQGRIEEAKATLRCVKPAVADGLRADSHLKAYERAQEMLKDLDSPSINSPDTFTKAIEAFLNFSSVWQPQPCLPAPPPPLFPSNQKHDGFHDENLDLNIGRGNRRNNGLLSPPLRKHEASLMNKNSLNVDAPPFISKMARNHLEKNNLKRSRSSSLETVDYIDALPDSKEFEEAILAAAIGCEARESVIYPRQVHRRLVLNVKA
ncbi:hypothetical protein AMTRI_Chr09g18780 [Amborella trichopoda]